MSPESMAAMLLPRPHSLRLTGAWWRVPQPLTVRLAEDLREAVAADLAACADVCRRRLGAPLEVAETAGWGAEAAGLCIHLATAERGGFAPQQERVSLPPADEQGYALTVTPTGATLRAPTAAGVANGLRTIAQIVELAGDAWPTFDIEDAPAFTMRGLSLDISRGRVPTLDSLHTLVNRLAALKCNHLELYTEHTFAFEFDPEIAAGSDALTADDVRALDAHCRAHHIELVPSLACFGHMGRILSLPRYRELAEIPATSDWDAMTWDDRTRGLTLDASQPAARELLRAMIDEMLPAFSSQRFNVCCDETWDLGKGRGKVRAAEIGAGRMFLEHLLWLRTIAAEHGRTILFWGDVIKNHPELIGELPRDVTVLNWGYTRDFDYESTAQFRALGFDTTVCPATHGWNRAVHDLGEAEETIRRQADAGARHGATGLLNTEWGDGGHPAPPGSAHVPIALGAALAWNPSGPTGEDFDAALARLAYGLEDAAPIAAWRRAVAPADIQRVWPALYAPLHTITLPERFDRPALERWEDAARTAAAAFAALTPTCEQAARDCAEIELALRVHALVARRCALTLRLTNQERGASLTAALRDLAESCDQIVPEVEAAWLATSRPACLGELTAVFRRIAAQAQRAAAGA